MISFVGKSNMKKIATGPIYILDKDKEREISKREVKDATKELKKLSDAITKVDKDLTESYRIASLNADKEVAEVFNAYKLFLLDDVYLNDITTLIREENVNAEYAVSTVSDRYATVFSGLSDENASSKASDVKDISFRLIKHILGDKDTCSLQIPSIIVATELTPSDTLSFDRGNILAFVTKKGSLNSHCSILAHTMGIPAIICKDLDVSKLTDGSEGVVDGVNSVFIAEPDSNTRISYSGMLYAQDTEKMRLVKYRDMESVSPDGLGMKVLANIDSIDDLDSCLYNGAEGIGLFRTEFLFINKETEPKENEQYEVYSKLLMRMRGKPVTIRTMDIGADKKAVYFDFFDEINPALGLRGIRLSLRNRESFKIQLKALFRASVLGDLSIMFPMISLSSEMDLVQEIVREAEDELKKSGAVYKIPRLGIMIETPSAALISDELAKKADFFSIGTNDLSQYTLAMDRQNGALDSMFDNKHPAVLKLIGLTVANAHANNIPVSVCGELASDTEMTTQFLLMGVDELSVSPNEVLKIREKIVSFKNT